MGILRRLFGMGALPGASARVRPGKVTVSPGRVETRFGDPVRVVFQVDVPGGGNHPPLRWTVRKLDGSPLITAGYLADPSGEKGVFLAFPVEKTLICRVRATVSGGARFGEATLVIHPPDRSGGKCEEADEAIPLSQMGLCGAA